LELVTLTDGVDPDLDGYGLQVDDSPSLTVPSSGTATMPRLAPGDHTMALVGVAGNCYTEPALPQSFTISAGELTRVTLQITCLRAYPLPFDLAFTAAGPQGSGTGSIFIMPAAGGGDRPTVRIPLLAGDLRWSPDGSRLAFFGGVGSDRDIYTVLADGGDLRRLTNAPGPDVDPRWSPDGTRLLFTSYRDGDGEVYLMEADGSGQVNLSNHEATDSRADWSPDGARVVFLSLREAMGSELYAMNSDGSSVVRLANAEDRGGTDLDPVWSPDASEIAFWTQEPFDGSNHPSTVYRMSADGSDVRVVATGSPRRPLWSPDGARLLGVVVTPGPSLSDGPFSTVVTWDLTFGESTNLSEGWTPAWSPDGGLVAFAHVPTNEFSGPLGIIAAEGGEVTDLTAFSIDEAPAWRPTQP
jgi:Tol biopolymer transport system component